MAILDFVNFNGERLDLQDSALTAYVRDMSPVATVGPADAVSVDDAAPLSAEGLVVNVEPVQAGSGDPSPTNVRPISGWDGVTVTATGANIWDEEWESGRYNTTTGEPGPTTTMIRSKSTNYIPVSSNANYYFNANGVVFYYDKFKVFLSSQTVSNTTFTTPNDAAYLRFRLSADYGTTYNNDVAINSPATVTTYEPYKSRTASVDFSETIYGGTVDLATGECVITRKRYNAADLAGWGLADSSSSETHKVWRTADSAFSGEISKAASWGLCSKYKGAFGVAPINIPESSFVTNGSGVLYVCDSRFSTLDAFLASCGDCQFVFDLAEPITIAMTPAELELFKSINNISADAGQVTVTYRQDVFLALNKRINELQALVLEL